MRGDGVTAQAAMKAAMRYAQRGTGEAIASKKHRKEVEISLRKLARRLTNLASSLPLDQRTTLESDVAVLEKLRSQLLSSLFGLNAEP